MEKVKNRIAVKESPWDKFSHNEFKLKSKYLIPKLGNWYLFIAASIIPTSHTYSLSKERLLLLDAIYNESSANIGKIIHKKIMACSDKKSGYLFYPCLITELCIQQGVQSFQSEIRQQKTPLSDLPAYFKEKKVIAKPEPMQPLQEHWMRRMKAAWKFQDEQHDWIKLRFAELSEQQSQYKSPEFPKWILDDEGGDASYVMRRRLKRMRKHGER
jgi:hypothetical protein